MKVRNSEEIEATLSALQLVPVVSLPSVDAGLRLAEILIRNNLPVVEVTFRTACATEAITAMKNEFTELLILAGTVLSEEQVDVASQAGVECIVIPGFEQKLVEYCLSKNMLVCPGVVTPSEALQCLRMGLKNVKFFPAEVAGGVAMLKAMSAVFADIKFMPTGGIGPGNVHNYLALDTVFCCGGSWLAPDNLMVEGKWEEIDQLVSAANQLISENRS